MQEWLVESFTLKYVVIYRQLERIFVAYLSFKGVAPIRPASYPSDPLGRTSYHKDLLDTFSAAGLCGASFLFGRFLVLRDRCKYPIDSVRFLPILFAFSIFLSSSLFDTERHQICF